MSIRDVIFPSEVEKGKEHFLTVRAPSYSVCFLFCVPVVPVE